MNVKLWFLYLQWIWYDYKCVLPLAALLPHTYVWFISPTPPDRMSLHVLVRDVASRCVSGAYVCLWKLRFTHSVSFMSQFGISHSLTLSSKARQAFYSFTEIKTEHFQWILAFRNQILGIAVVSIFPFLCQEAEAWMKLAERVSEKALIVGDRVFHRPGRLLQEDLSPAFKTSGWMTRFEQRTTVSEVMDCAQKMRGRLGDLLVILIAGHQCSTQKILNFIIIKTFVTCSCFLTENWIRSYA